MCTKHQLWRLRSAEVFESADKNVVVFNDVEIFFLLVDALPQGRKGLPS